MGLTRSCSGIFWHCSFLPGKAVQLGKVSSHWEGAAFRDCRRLDMTGCHLQVSVSEFPRQSILPEMPTLGKPVGLVGGWGVKEWRRVAGHIVGQFVYLRLPLCFEMLYPSLLS